MMYVCLCHLPSHFSRPFGTEETALLFFQDRDQGCKITAALDKTAADVLHRETAGLEVEGEKRDQRIPRLWRGGRRRFFGRSTKSRRVTGPGGLRLPEYVFDMLRLFLFLALSSRKTCPFQIELTRFE